MSIFKKVPTDPKLKKEQFLKEFAQLQKKYGYEKMLFGFNEQELAVKIVNAVKSQPMVLDFTETI